MQEGEAEARAFCVDSGQERSIIPTAQHTACTIEMTNLLKRVDVAVIDEIQVGPTRTQMSSTSLLWLPDDGNSGGVALLEHSTFMFECGDAERICRLCSKLGMSRGAGRGLGRCKGCLLTRSTCAAMDLRSRWSADWQPK